jgi:hypothetical protein
LLLERCADDTNRRTFGCELPVVLRLDGDARNHASRTMTEQRALFVAA